MGAGMDTDMDILEMRRLANLGAAQLLPNPEDLDSFSTNNVLNSLYLQLKL
jgi:hypothetical protein